VAVAAAQTPAGHACSPKARARHRPEETVLHQVLSGHFEEFEQRAEEAGGLPQFVVKEVQQYLRCGLLEYGLLHCQCQCCGHDEVCAFSCKRRGFCPSCLGRRMTDTALNLVQSVLPAAVPVRQWVCSLPWRLRVLCGYDSALCAVVMKAFEKEVS
jgi:Transposase zinc-binding domain